MTFIAVFLGPSGDNLGSFVEEIKEGILTVASEWGADLIVVTSHARKGVSKFLHRSVAQGIVHRAPCSVLVPKESAKKAAA